VGRVVFGRFSGESDGGGRDGVGTAESFAELAGGVVIAAILAEKVVFLRIR